MHTLLFLLFLLGTALCLLYGISLILGGLWLTWYSMVTGGQVRRGYTLLMVAGGVLLVALAGWCLKGVMTEAVVLGLQREAAGASVLVAQHPEGLADRSLRPSPCFAFTANPACVASASAAPGGYWEGAKPTPPAMATTTHPYRHCDYCKRETTSSNKYQRYERRAWTLFPTTRMFCCPECRARGWNDEHAAIRLKVRAELQREQFGAWLDANDAQDAERAKTTATT